MGIRGERIKARRLALGVPGKPISQAEVAERVSRVSGKKISQQNIEQAEAKTVSNPHYILDLPAALETTIEYLSGRTDDPSLKDLVTKAYHNGPSGDGNVGREGEKTMQFEIILTELQQIRAGMNKLQADVEILKGADRPPPENPRRRPKTS